MAYLVDELHCDSQAFYASSPGQKVAQVEDASRAAVFEIGRIMRDMACPAFKADR